MSDFVYPASVVVLFRGGEGVIIFENDFLRLRTGPLHSGLRDRCDEVRDAAGLDDSLGRLSLAVEFPMP